MAGTVVLTKSLQRKTASSHGGKKGSQGLDLFPKWDSESAGVYCSRGHLVSTSTSNDEYCPKCDVSLSISFVEREHHE